MVRFVATVLLPTPPLPLITRMMFFTSGHGSSVPSARVGSSSIPEHLDPATPSSLPSSAGRAPDLAAERRVARGLGLRAHLGVEAERDTDVGAHDGDSPHDLEVVERLRLDGVLDERERGLDGFGVGTRAG